MSKDLFANNAPQIFNSGRVYCYADNRWVTDSDDNYGPNYYQWAEPCGTAVNPILEWEHIGHIVHKGEKLKRFEVRGRVNNLEVTDLEIYAVFKHPTPITRWETGIDNDTEVATFEVFRDFFKFSSDPAQPAFSGNLNGRERRVYTLDYTCPEDGDLMLYFKPVGTITANRYFIVNYRWN